MKRTSTHLHLRFLPALVLTLLLTASGLKGWGQTLLLNEDFSYAVGNLLTINGWTAHSGTGTNNIAVSSSSISYPGYLSSGIGDETSLAASGQDINHTFTNQTAGSVYASLLVNVTAATITGDYFFHFCQVGGASAGTFDGRVFVKKDASNNLSFGISKASGTVIYSSFSYSLNTTYLVVLKYTFNPTASDDVVYLFINPALNAVEPSALLTSTDVAADLTGAIAIALRQGAAANGAALKLDGIRVATTWADIVGAVSSGVNDPTSVTATPFSTTQINLGWALNANSNNVMVAFNTTNTFGTPVDGTAYAISGTIPGGGTVLYNSTGTSLIHTPLSPSTPYYYKVFSVDGSNNYSTGVSVSANTLNPEPSNNAINFTASTVTPTFSAIDVTWTDATGGTVPEGYVVKASPVDYGSIVVNDGTPETAGILVKIVAPGIQVAHFTGLTGNTPYYFEIFPFTNSGTNINFKSDLPPQATVTTTATPPLAKVFISEYLEGSASNKAVEIYNGESTAIDLTKLSVKLYTNGGITASSTYTGTGILNANTAIVLFNGSSNAEIIAAGNVNSGVANFNGDDVIEVIYDYQTTDIFGTIGTDPGTSWTIAGDVNGAVDKTLLRKLTTTQGNPVGSASFGTDATNSEWVINSTIDYAKNLGSFCTAWTGTTDQNWVTATNWDMGTPTGTTNAMIPDVTNDPVINEAPGAPALCRDLTIQAGAVLTIAAGKALTASGNTFNKGTFTMLSEATGTGSFIDNGTITGTGAVNVQNYLTGSGGSTPNGRFWYIGSPVSNGLSGVFDAMGDNRLWYYNEVGGAYSEIITNGIALAPLQGFVARLGATETINFTGTLNTGTIGGTTNLSRTTTGVYDGYNLVSNPYPSAINWGSFASPTTGLTQTNLETTIWYRSSGAFATYNWQDGIGVNGGQQYIPSMQAFWVRVLPGTTGGLQLDNTSRVHNAQAFYKSATAETNVFRMNVSNGVASDEIVIGFWANAKGTFEDHDSRKMLYTDDNVPQTYSLTSDAIETAINGQAELAPNEERIVPVGFSTPVSGAFSFNALNLNGFDATIPVYLRDSQANVVTDLRQSGSYTFASDVVNNANRFSLYFGNADITGIADKSKTPVSIYANGNTIYVNSPEQGKGQIEIFDITGQKILSRPSVQGLNKIQVNVNTGIYIVKVQNGTGLATGKVMIGK